VSGTVNVDWLHLEAAGRRWFCEKQTAPRRWELCVPFRVVFKNGQSELHEFAVTIEEFSDLDPPGQRASERERFRMGREFLHTQIEELARARLFYGRAIASVLPANLTFNPMSDQFPERFDLIDPDDEHPHTWHLRDKLTGKVVRFDTQPGLTQSEQLERVKDAMYRIDELNRRSKARVHAQLPAQSSRGRVTIN